MYSNDYAEDQSLDGVRFILDNFRELRQSDGFGRQSVLDYLLTIEQGLDKAGLTDRERQIINIRYLQDTPVEEVARYVGVSPRTVQYDSTRAIRKLYVYVNEVVA